MRSHTARLIALITLALAAGDAARAQDVPDLLPYVPKTANAIAVLRVHDLTHSARGEREGWAQKHETEFLQGSVTIPPWVELFVRASYERPGMRGGDWTVVLVPLPAQFNMSQLAAREGGDVQDIGGHSAVFSQRHNGYFVELGGSGAAGARILGGMSPATRQDVGRWVQQSAGAADARGLSSYLIEAVQDESDQIVLAVDLQDMFDPVLIRYRLDGLEALQGKPRDKTALTLAFQTLRGLRIDISVADAAFAEVHMDFGRQLGDEAAYLKPLLVEFLNDAGAALEELDQSVTTVDGKTATMKMPLSDESLRRVLSLLTSPPPPSRPDSAVAGQSPAPPAAGERAAPSAELTASRRYFTAVNRNLDDLQKAYSRAKSYTQTAQWHLNFADRIDHLPTAGVDPKLIAYGHDISDKLRALAASLRGTGVEVDALNRSVTYQVYEQPAFNSGFNWWWGGARTAFGPYNYGQPTAVSVDTNLPEVRRKQAEIVAASAPQREQIWQIINDQRSATERAMVGEFGEDFQKPRP